MTATPNETWDLRGGTAWVFTARGLLGRPVLLAGDPGTGADDLAAAADHPSYSLLAALRDRGHDLILLGLDADASMTRAGGTVESAIRRTAAERVGAGRLTVGGTAGGALAARYALASMEYRSLDHETRVFFSHDGEAPGLEDEAELSRTGRTPRSARTLRLLDEGVTDGLADDDFDESAPPGTGASGPLLSEEYGSWLLDRLP
ncbi:hypothetical protein [Streptomyces sp. NK15101]|uniref:hypothetical protein n=1 Tax=Streptomyces sp. NK15101 TaxID=2873261 RepID=UPI001CED9400|nr:hypothetical protein [Streptomyces sp. NK15101]